MKELFRERDYTRVGYYQSVLESEGIETFVRNQHVVTMTTEVPIPDMFPALCIVNDQDDVRAIEILRDLAPAGKEREDRVSGVFLVGIALIFGCVALQLVLPILYEWPVSKGTLIFSGSIALGSIWIVWITARRWHAQRLRSRRSESE